MKKSQVQFDAKSLRDEITQKLTQQQTLNFIVYAMEELNEMRNTHEFANRTYNLEDSYVWAVFYNGSIPAGGYGYLGSTKATKRRGEYSGREEAQKFIQSYKPRNKKGWEVVWAATMPYATKLEKGEYPRRHTFYVVSQRYDDICRELGPKCLVTIKL